MALGLDRQSLASVLKTWWYVIAVALAAIALTYSTSTKAVHQTQTQVIIACTRGNSIRNFDRFVIDYLITNTKPKPSELVALLEQRAAVKNVKCSALFTG